VTVEKIGIEHVPEELRHGKTTQLFTLWLASNLTIADYALGFLPVSLGLPFLSIVIALLVGNVLGSLFLAVSVAMGPRMGFPQMLISRLSFGRRGNYFFAVLNWVSTAGWFTVNVILGTFALQILLPSMPFYLGAAVTVVVEVLLAIFGYDVIHGFERFMAVLLGALFAFATLLVLDRGYAAISSFSPRTTGGSVLAIFGITLAAAFSYVMSWSPYGSDYSRYLPEKTPYRASIVNSFLGAFIGSFWLEVLGALVAILAPSASNAISALPAAFGIFGMPIVVAIILGGVAANVLNIYTNALSALVLDVRTKRWILVVLGGCFGFLLALYGARDFGRFYEQFLLLLDYWITPWLGILAVDFFVLKRTSLTSLSNISWRAIISYVIGILVSLAFIPSIGYFGYSGPVAQLIGGADFSYFASFLVSTGLYYLTNRCAYNPITSSA
jgi:NCS1 family nucleobase:cation symporter-1